MLESRAVFRWTARVRLFLVSFFAMFCAACATSRPPLEVKSHQLRDEKRDPGGEPLVMMEKERRLHGAISMAERRQRLGQYYTVQWHDDSPGSAIITFHFLQGKSGSREKFKRQEFAEGISRGVAEFAVIGDDYFNNGRVTAWKITLSKSGRVIASRQSYLWK